MSDHPEDFCDRCGGKNISWQVESDRWNAATEALKLSSEVVLCPSCFVQGHEAATAMTCGWTIVPSTPFRWIEKLGGDVWVS